MTRRSAVPALGVLVALAAVLLPAAPAAAHAVLESSTPKRGAELASAPESVEFRFNEPVELSFGSLRVFDAEGEEVQEGDPTHPGGEAERIAVAMEGQLPDGAYTATYRVVSADAHPVSGGIVFSVGEAAAPATSVSELLDEGESGAVTDTAFAFARWLSYFAIALAAGGALFLAASWAPALRRVAGPAPGWERAAERFGARARGLLWLAVGLGLLGTAAGIVLQGAVASGTSAFDAARPGVIGDVLDTRFGTVWAIRGAIWVALAAALIASRRLGPPSARPSPVTAALALLLAGLCLTPALAGHASTQTPGWALVPANAVHVAAMSAWVGGLVMLVAALPAATGALERPQRSTLLSAVLPRFSAIALGSVAVLLATGVLQSALELESLSALYDSAFGRLILVKAALLAVLIGLGAYNRRRSVPEMQRLASEGSPPGATGMALRRVLRIEVALVAAAILATSFLVAQTPSAQGGEGPAAGSLDLDAARLDYTVDPATVGSNEMHFYLTAPDTGTPFEVREAEAQASLPDEEIGPLELQLERSGPGHFTAPNAALGVRGEWEIELRGTVSRFEQVAGQFEVEIR